MEYKTKREIMEIRGGMKSKQRIDELERRINELERGTTFNFYRDVKTLVPNEETNFLDSKVSIKTMVYSILKHLGLEVKINDARIECLPKNDS